MKHTNLKTSIVLTTFVAAIMLCTLSCNNDQKTEDTKVVAEEHNEAKFTNSATENDAQFLVNAAEINLEEIQLGALAQQKSKTKIVKDLGKMMEKEHSSAMQALTELAGKKMVTIPTAPTDNAIEAYKKLNDKSGNDFDNAYCKLMVDGHTKAVALFEKASTEATDSNIKAWATEMLPTLRTHLDHSINCQKECEKAN